MGLNFGKIVFGVVAGALLTGFILDELGQGRLGAVPQLFAKKVTRGFGDGN